jgi:alpha-mannosidase
MDKPIFHLIANAHLDPVWSWDWREGLNEAIITSRAILAMMDEDRELTFMRGESAIYEHIETHDPETFARIAAYVKAGRWDPVGGTVVQSDTNLTSTETLLHSYMLGQEYLRSRFGRRARVAWFADSFGHSGGLPEIFAAAGIDSFAFTRPGAATVPIAKPAFWWEGTGGSRVLAYRPPAGWYGCERDEMPRRLDAVLESARGTDLRNVGVFFGLGNHGGGPSRRNLADIRKWGTRHPEVTMRFSTLHELMAALRQEAERGGAGFLPVHRGELNYCLRGCYSSIARVKFLFRKTEAQACRAERTAAVVGAAAGGARRFAGTKNAWAGLAFNSFHDILPGSIIERAAEEQIAWMGGALHRARRVEADALLALAARIDTRVDAPEADHPSAVPLLVWNPHPHDYEGPVEIETPLDYRPIWEYRGRADELPVELRDADGKPLPFQRIPTEHLAMPDFPWRKRVVTRLRVPALGWRLVTMAWKEKARVPATKNLATAPRAGAVTNGLFTVSAKVGDRGVRVARARGPLLASPGLHAVTVKDPWGSWGDMAEGKESLNLSTVVASWRVTGVQNLESGPERAMLWVRLEGGKSRLELRLSVSRGRAAVDAEARLLWNERSSRLKLVLPCGGKEAELEVPGGLARRGPVGEMPGGRWVRVLGRGGAALGFASDALYNFDLTDGALRATVVRATRWSCDRVVTAKEEPWTPATDAGEHRFRFLLTAGGEELGRAARELEEPVVVTAVPTSPGSLPRVGSLARVLPRGVRIVALKPADDGKGTIIALQTVEGGAVSPKVEWLGTTLALGRLAAGKIGAWRIVPDGKGWRAEPASALE